MRTVCIIEARMRSSRLPGKVMLPILGRPMIELMIERLRGARTLDDIVIATVDHESCEPIVELAHDLGISAFRGSEDDVLLRVLEAAQKHEADVIVEVTGDCPLHDPALIDKVVSDFRLGGADFVSNVLPRTTPLGTDIRVFKTKDLAEVNRISEDSADHEHVSLRFMEHPEIYRQRNVVTEFGKDAADFRITVDTREDFELITAIYETLYPENPAFDLNDILELLRARPDLVALNATIKQKAAR